MKTIFSLTLKSASRDPFLLLWSVLLPIGGAIGLGIFIQAPEYPQHILTGMIAVSILFYAFMTTSFAILSQRRRGVYHLLRVTPMSLLQYVVSVSGAWTLISFLCAMLVLGSGALALKLHLSIQSILALIPMILLGATGYVLFSFVISSLSRTENNVSIITNIITLPVLFGSSAFYSLDHAPRFVKMLNYFNPFQWFINGLRSTFEYSWNNYFMNIGLLLLVAAVACILAIKTFQYTE